MCINYREEERDALLPCQPGEAGLEEKKTRERDVPCTRF
jgi:hypothetical protein